MSAENNSANNYEQLGYVYGQVADEVSEQLANEYVQSALEGKEKSHQLHVAAQEILNDDTFPKADYLIFANEADSKINFLKTKLRNDIDKGLLTAQEKRDVEAEIAKQEDEKKIADELNREERLQTGDDFQAVLRAKAYDSILSIFSNPLDFYTDPNLTYPVKLTIEKPASSEAGVKSKSKEEAKDLAKDKPEDASEPKPVPKIEQKNNIPESDETEAKVRAKSKSSTEDKSKDKSKDEEEMNKKIEARRNLEAARLKFAESSLKKGRLVRKNSHRGRAINKDYESLGEEYRNKLDKYLELSGIKDIKQLTDLTLREFNDFNKAQFIALKNENNRAARISRWLSKHHTVFNLISGATFGIGSSLILKNSLKGVAALGLGVAAPVGIGVGLAGRAARASIMGIVGNRKYQEDQLDARGQEDSKRLKAVLETRGDDTAHKDASDLGKMAIDYSLVASDDIWSIINERVKNSQKENRTRVIKSALFAGAAGLAGSVVVEYSLGGTNIINAIHHPTPNQLRDTLGIAGGGVVWAVIVNNYKRLQQWSSSPVAKDDGRPGFMRGSYRATKRTISRIKDY